MLIRCESEAGSIVRVPPSGVRAWPDGRWRGCLSQAKNSQQQLPPAAEKGHYWSEGQHLAPSRATGLLRCMFRLHAMASMP